MTTTRIQLWILLSSICISVSVVYGKPQRKISDGEKVWDVPYQVAIQDTFLVVHCVGAIIDASHILTSAHCIVDGSGRALLSNARKIIVGTIDVLNQTEKNVYNILEVTIHEGYNANDSFHNDIAIIKLDRAIEFTRNQKPISLPVNDTIEGTSVTATGWGAIEYDESTKIVGPYPRFLQKSSEEVISQERCQEMMSDESIHPTQICAWSEGWSVACFGDSGGPLVDFTFIVGITSFNKVCNPLYPTVYTRVYKYVEWIKNVTNFL